ncbi:Glycoside hydrolase family 2 protein [Flavobacterium daejeonense]|nr:Glycoside hydrolase family 2 protein [Flavobacterium daejeonense]
MFAEHGFAGVEVQPFIMGLNPNAPKEQMDRIYSWDTPSFDEHLQAIMQQAQNSKIIVDMNAGSGWPLGGTFFDPRESMRTLAVVDTLLIANSIYNGALPLLKFPDAKAQDNSDVNIVKPQWAIVKSVIGAKVSEVKDNQIILDSKSIIDLTAKIKNNTLRWKVPGDQNWRLIVCWSVPTGEKPSLIASKGMNYVIDHLDSKVVNKTYDYLLGKRTGLHKYFSNPLRAVFNDSYEFHVDRIISPNLIEVFKKENGYDITPFLSSVYQKGYNHAAYLADKYADSKPAYVFDIQNHWRIMYDYDQIVNKVFRDNFIKTSNNWMRSHGLVHRTQAYGFPIDLISAAAMADIPEAEQLYGDGSEGFLKLVTSGAHLNNRPVITQESFVSAMRAEMTTPQKIKVWADKSFACGINQLIYHGTPYKYNNGEFGKEGWNTWSTPYLPQLNFSTGMNESDPFWRDIKDVNEYLSRCQYALRSGKPLTDVLIYMPFNNFAENQIGLNPEETMIKGYFKGVEPEINEYSFKTTNLEIKTWFDKLWKTINRLEEKGITWEFVNDDFLQKAKIKNGKIDIQGNQYQTLILADLPFVNLKTAKSIQTLNKTGMKVWAVGDCPEKQPSYLDYQKNDKLASELMHSVWNNKHTVKITTNLPVETIKQDLVFVKEARFSRQINRQMADGSLIKFISNKTDQWQTIEIKAAEKFKNSYWFNAEDGSAAPAQGSTFSYRLAPYGSVILFASTAKVNLELDLKEPVGDQLQSVLDIDKWNIKIGENTFTDSLLFDWRDNKETKFISEDGLYTANFSLEKIQKGKSYFIDLGKVYYVARVKINGQDAGKRFFAPYSLDITSLLKEGNNKVEVLITTTRRNGFTGEGIKGNPQYRQYKGKGRILVPSGMVGPVLVKVK